MRVLIGVISLAAFVGFFLGSAHASEQAGTVSNVSIRATDGLIMANVDGSRSDRPACATRTYWAIKDESSAAGRNQYAALLAARVSGASVSIVGTGACTRWLDAEDINWVYLKDQ